MAQKDAKKIQEELAQPFAPEDLEWRLQKTAPNGEWGLAVPYVTNRAIQTRLDDVVGPDNWCNDYKPWHPFSVKVRSEEDRSKLIEKEVASQICGISIYFEGKGWITKWDGAEDSDIEPIKGGLSDSMKRAAVQWGVGRVLYNLEAVFVDVERQGKTWIIAKKDRPKLDKAYLAMLAALGQKPGQTGAPQPKPAPDRPQPRSAAEAPLQPQGAQRGEVVQLPMPQPAYEFKVVNARLQNGMNSSSTQLVLETPEGKRLNAFAKGVHSELVPDVMLHHTKLTMRKQDTVVFYILEAYKVLPTQTAA